MRFVVVSSTGRKLTWGTYAPIDYIIGSDLPPDPVTGAVYEKRESHLVKFCSILIKVIGEDGESEEQLEKLNVWRLFLYKNVKDKSRFN